MPASARSSRASRWPSAAEPRASASRLRKEWTKLNGPVTNGETMRVSPFEIRVRIVPLSLSSWSRSACCFLSRVARSPPEEKSPEPSSIRPTARGAAGGRAATPNTPIAAPMAPEASAAGEGVGDEPAAPEETAGGEHARQVSARALPPLVPPPPPLTPPELRIRLSRQQ